MNSFTKFRVLICILFPLYAIGQAKIVGNVYYQNSGWKPAEGISVNAKGSNGDYSKSDGAFLLFFANLIAGTTVYPSIGKNNVALDIKGREMELINHEELKYFTIPNNPQDAPLKIIVAPKGERLVTAQKYFRIFKLHYNSKVKTLKLEIATLKEKLDKSNELVFEKQDLLEKYQKQFDSLVLYNRAYQIAGINKDGASERTRNYLEALDKGIAVEEAMSHLNPKKAFEEVEQSFKNVIAGIEEIQLKARANETLLEYEKAFSLYDSINLLTEKINLSYLYKISNLLEAGELARKINQFNRSLQYQKNALSTLDKNQIGNNEVRALVELDLSFSYQSMGNYKRAFERLKKNLKWVLKSDKTIENKLLLGKLYYNLGASLIAIKNPNDIKYQNEAKGYLLRAIELLEPIFKVNPYNVVYYLSSSYERLGHLYRLDWDFLNTEKYLKQSIEIFDTLTKKEKNNFRNLLANNYMILAGHFGLLGKLKETNSLNIKALIIFEKLSDENPKRYNLQYAQFLDIIAASKVGQLVTLSSRNLDGELTNLYIQLQKDGNDLIKKIHELLHIYDQSNFQVKRILNSSVIQKLWFSDKMDLNQTLNYDSLSASELSMFLLRKSQLINKRISDTEKLSEKKKLIEILIENHETVYSIHQDNLQIKQLLGSTYANVAHKSILWGNYDFALDLTKKLGNLDNRTWSGYNRLVLVNIYILLNKPYLAWPIYKKYVDEIFPGTNQTYRQNFLADIKELESNGVYHKEFNKIKKFLQK